jgi:hypothetical protein
MVVAVTWSSRCSAQEKRGGRTPRAQHLYGVRSDDSETGSAAYHTRPRRHNTLQQLAQAAGFWGLRDRLSGQGHAVFRSRQGVFMGLIHGVNRNCALRNPLSMVAAFAYSCLELGACA